MHSRLLVGLLVLVLIGLGIYWFVQLDSSPTSDTPPVGVTNDPGRIAEEREYYDIAVTYPTSTPLRETAGDRADQIAVELMKGFLTTTIAQFKADGNFENLTAEDIERLGYGDGRKQTLSIGHLSTMSTSTLSYVFTLNSYTLGAHGNTYYKTFTFDTASGRSLKLSDLFMPQTAYLSRISSSTRASLSRQLELPADDTMISAGTAPTDANFQDFFLDNESLVFLFPPYAVAAYAAGPQTVAIPRSELADILKSDYR